MHHRERPTLSSLASRGRQTGTQIHSTFFQQKKTNESRIDAHSKKEMTSGEFFLSSVDQIEPSFSLKRSCDILRLKRRETEKDSVSCPMKYSTDIECRSDSLAVISSRDINQFTHVNLSYDTIRSDGLQEGACRCYVWIYIVRDMVQEGAAVWPLQPTVYDIIRSHELQEWAGHGI